MAPTTVTRSEWGARPPKSPPTPLNEQGMGLHYSGALNDSKADHSLCDDVWKGFQNFHMDGRGWNDIAYNFGVCIHGVIFEGRGWQVRSAAFGSNDCNGKLIAVCFIGGDKENFQDVTEEAREAIVYLHDQLLARKSSAKTLLGHRDCKATSCPGNELQVWLKAGLPMDGSVPLPKPPAPAPAPTPPPASHPAWPGQYFKYPPLYRSEAVKTWQRQMAHRGWKIAVDGAYGAESKSVATKFQQEKHLTVDGIVGKQTWDAAWTAPVT